MTCYPVQEWFHSTRHQGQGRRNALISGQVNWKKKQNGGSGCPPPEIFFRFGALRGGSGDFWTEQASEKTPFYPLFKI